MLKYICELSDRPSPTTSTKSSKSQLLNKRESVCNICNKHFSSYSAMLSHKNSSHKSSTTRRPSANSAQPSTKSWAKVWMTTQVYAWSVHISVATFTYACACIYASSVFPNNVSLLLFHKTCETRPLLGVTIKQLLVILQVIWYAVRIS